MRSYYFSSLAVNEVGGDFFVSVANSDVVVTAVVVKEADVYFAQKDISVGQRSEQLFSVFDGAFYGVFTAYYSVVKHACRLVFSAVTAVRQCDANAFLFLQSVGKAEIVTVFHGFVVHFALHRVDLDGNVVVVFGQADVNFAKGGHIALYPVRAVRVFALRGINPDFKAVVGVQVDIVAFF